MRLKELRLLKKTPPWQKTQTASETFGLSLVGILVRVVFETV